MIERFVLPDLSVAQQGAIHCMGRAAVDSLHDLHHAEWSVVIGQWRENQMHVVRYNDGSVQIETLAVSPETGVENDAARLRWKYPAVVSRETRKDSGVILWKRGRWRR